MRRPLLAATAVAAVLGSLAIATPAAAAATDIRINEVQSNSATSAQDFVELTNIGTVPVDVSGWVLRDSDDAHALSIADGTTIEPGGLLVLEPDSGTDGFGLGKADSARIFAVDGTLVDEVSWSEHVTSAGRVPDGTGAFVDTEPTPGAVNVARAGSEQYDADAPVAINEVMSDDPAGGEDWVELTNVGDEPVDVSGWILRDDDDLSSLPIADGMSIEPGAFLVIETNVTDAGFGLGSADEVRLFLEDGLGLVDEHAWGSHVSTHGRLPDGTGAFVDTEPTPGAANVARAIASAVAINEVETNGDARGDWVELANTDQTQTADVSGWSIIDGDPSHEPIVLGEGTEIESGGYLGIITDAAFGLGNPDSVTLRDAEGAVVATLSWQEHSPTTIGRCPDMTGAFAASAVGTFELPNDCDGDEEPPVEVDPWPFDPDVRDAVAAGTWGEDMSGLDVSSAATVYAVNNDNAEVFELAGGQEAYTVAQSWVPRYPDGSGTPDAEGITVAGDGAIFLSTERDNEASGVSRPSVLRVELGAAGATTTTHEWYLTDITGPLGANAGIEAIEWISDADATRLDILGQSGAYDPAAFGEHFGGIVAVAVEQTGALHLLVLEADGTITLLQTAPTSEAVPVVMGLDWRAGGNELWALCDEACDNRHSVFAVVGGTLTGQADVAAPAGMHPSFTNEGLAMLWCEEDDSASPTVLWISDTAHEGVSLRVAPGDDCATQAGPTDPEHPTQPTAPIAPQPIHDRELDDADRGGVEVQAEAERGQTIAVTVPGLEGDTVHVWLHSEPELLATVEVGPGGVTHVTIPMDADLGEHRIVVQSEGGALVGWAPIEIVDAAAVSGSLPETGVELVPWLSVAALALLLAGASLTRRRAS